MHKVTGKSIREFIERENRRNNPNWEEDNLRRAKIHKQLDESMKGFQEEYSDQDIEESKAIMRKYLSPRGPELVQYYGILDPLGTGKIVYIGMTANAAWVAVRSIFTSKNSPCKPLYRWWQKMKTEYPKGLYIPGREVLQRYWASEHGDTVPIPIPLSQPGKFKVEWEILHIEEDTEGWGTGRNYQWTIASILEERGEYMDLNRINRMSGAPE